jgi:hypothetical protein
LGDQGFHEAMKKDDRALRPWTIDFHVAQNDATVQMARARTTRPAGIACRTIPTASSTSCATPVTGCATNAAR